MENKEVTGRDISRPTDHLELGGVDYPLAFDLACMRVAEDVYEVQYGRNVNFANIVMYLAAGKLGAIMAILYGALLSGASTSSAPFGGTFPKGEGNSKAEPMTWEEFTEKFRLTSIPAVKELLMERVKDALPKAEGRLPAEGEGENPPQ